MRLTRLICAAVIVVGAVYVAAIPARSAGVATLQPGGHRLGKQPASITIFEYASLGSIMSRI